MIDTYTFLFFKIISFLGDTTFMLTFWGGVLIFLWIRGKKRYALFVLFSLILGMSITFLLKHISQIPRPIDALILETDSRFPSGHATMASLSASIYIAYIYLKKKYNHMSGKLMTLGAILWVCLVSYSRLYLKVHYPIDVIIGASIGVLSVVCAYHLFKHIEYKNKI